MLSGVPDVEAHHEYCYTHIQGAAVRYRMGLIDRPALLRTIREVHGAAVYYTKAGTWIDSSNKLSWVIEPLREIFPDARFVHLVRDGRKVTGSFFHKRSGVAYDDACVAITANWLKNRSLPMPPPEDRYWMNIPQAGQPFHEEFPSFNQFQRICYHWREVIRVINESFSRIPTAQRMTFKLEDLTTDKEALKEFVAFLGIEYQECFHHALKRPENVIIPQDFKLTPEQLEQFKTITGNTMEQLGYDMKSEMYEVKY